MCVICVLLHVCVCVSLLTNAVAVLQIELMDRVDDIYRNTSWDDDFSGYGVQIQQVFSRRRPREPPYPRASKSSARG